MVSVLSLSSAEIQPRVQAGGTGLLVYFYVNKNAVGMFKMSSFPPNTPFVCSTYLDHGEESKLWFAF